MILFKNTSKLQIISLLCFNSWRYRKRMEFCVWSIHKRTRC
jgi:hypothetical protein